MTNRFLMRRVVKVLDAARTEEECTPVLARVRVKSPHACRFVLHAGDYPERNVRDTPPLSYVTFSFFFSSLTPRGRRSPKRFRGRAITDNHQTDEEEGNSSVCFPSKLFRRVIIFGGIAGVLLISAKSRGYEGLPFRADYRATI